MATTFAGRVFYGGGDVVLGLVFLANAQYLGSPAQPIGLFLTARGALTLIGIEFA